MARFYDIDFDRLILLLLPTRLRTGTLFSFLKAAIAPLRTIYNRFYATRQEILFLLKYDASKGNIERMLNGKFQTDGIYIVNNNEIDNAIYLSNADIAYMPVYLSNQGYIPEIERIYLDGSVYIDFFIDAQSNAMPDFTVMVPYDIHSVSYDEIVRYTGLFALPGMMFNVLAY